MVGFKENVIKLTDYPFIYSVTGSLFVIMFQKNINPLNSSNPSFNELIPVLIFIGIIGTIVTIINPLGRLTKFIILYKFQRLVFYHFSHLEHPKSKRIDPFIFLRKAVNTSWIEYEIDKLVSTLYFMIILVLLIIILGNPIYYNVYVQFVSLNLNSTNTNQSMNETILNFKNKDSEKTTSYSYLYSGIRIPVFIIFVIFFFGISLVFLHSVRNIRRKIQIVIDYFTLNELVARNVYTDTKRSEINNIDKNFLDSVNSHDWELAKQFVNRMQLVTERVEDNRINPSVDSNNKSNG